MNFDLSAVYGKTGKGAMAMTSKSKNLPADLMQALSLVDGKSSMEELLAENPKFSDFTLSHALTQLASEGYVKVLRSGPSTVFALGSRGPSTILVAETDVEEFFAAQQRMEAQSTSAANAQAHKIDELRTHEAAAARATAEAEAGERARQRAAEKARIEAEVRAKIEADRKAREEVAAKAEADEKARTMAEAEAKAKSQMKAKHKAEEEEQAKAIAEAIAAKEAARKAREKSEAKEKAEAEARKKAEQKAREEAEAIAKAEAEESAKAKAEEKARKEAERKVREAAEALARDQAKERKRIEATEKARVKAEEIARKETEQKAREAAEALAKAEAAERKRLAAEEKTRVEAEARVKAEEEARVRMDAAHKTRKEAEAKARADAEARAQRETEKRTMAEARAKEKTKTKAQKAAEKEEQERAEIEARARSLAEARATKDAATLQTKVRIRKPRKPIKLGRTTQISLALLVLVPLALLHVVSLNLFAPSIAKLAADRIHEPVMINAVRASLWPAPHLRLEGVTIGKLQDVKIATVRVMPALTHLFDETKILKAIEVESLAIDQDALPRVTRWLGSGGGIEKIQVEQIHLKNTKLDLRGMQLPLLNMDIDLASDSEFEHVRISSADNAIIIDVVPKGETFDIKIVAKNWQPPLALKPTFDELSAKATATREGMAISDIEGRLYGGTIKGAATVKWGKRWHVAGDFMVSRVDLSSATPALSDNLALRGGLDAKATYTMEANDLAGLFDTPRIKASFNSLGGAIGNVDLSGATMGQKAEEVKGGQTKFTRLTGNMLLAGNRYQFRQMKLESDVLKANGEMDILPNKELTGRVNVEMRMQSSIYRSHLSLAGNLRQPSMRR